MDVVKLLTVLTVTSYVSGQVQSDPLQYVDQLIGTDNGGNVFAGATLPYGMVKAVADVSGQNTGGFSTDGSNITGFSHMHDSGTGGNPSMGQFPLFPQSGPAGSDIDTFVFPKYDRAVNYVNDSIIATPGYFKLVLTNSIEAEMTVTEHAALYNFQFPTTTSNTSAPNNPIIILDLTDLSDSRQNASISVDPKTGRMKGNGTFLPSFGSGSYVLHYCADFQGAPVIDTGMYVNNRAGSEPKELFVTRGINLFYLQAGGFVRFGDLGPNSTISARVGTSFISADRACSHIEKEMAEWDFDKYKTTAEDAWRQKLSVVSIDAGGADDDLQKTFWSGLYRNMISPQNYTGENPFFKDSTEPYYDSFYCIWDQFRAQFPLLFLIDPTAASEMMRSLLSVYEHRGWLPDCSMTLSKGFTQAGSNADVVLTDAYLKDIKNVNWTLAFEAIINDAENEPLDWSVEGRGGLMSWKRLGYIPELDYDYLGFGTNSRSVSRTLEYSYDDFCLASLAQKLNQTQIAQKYLGTSGNWRNIFNPETPSSVGNYTGFAQPKYLNQTWGYQDPILCSALSGLFCSLTSNPTAVFETSIFEQTFYVPHDQSSLIQLLGGTDQFIQRLDTLHEYPGLIDIGNEPSFLTVYQYHYAGRPALSSRRAHTYIPSAFNASTTGLPGNDDSGAMGAFAVFAMTGLWPNPGQDVYLIMPPFFASVSWKSPIDPSKTATIKNINFDPSYNNTYIQSAKLNGEPYTKSWIGFEFFKEGMTLELELGPMESDWGTRTEDLPPSPGSAGGSPSPYTYTHSYGGGYPAL